MGGWLAPGAWAAHHGKQALPLGVRLSSDRCHPLASGQSAPATPFYFWPERLEGKGRTLATLSSDVVKKKKTFDPVGSANTITRIGALDFFFFFLLAILSPNISRFGGAWIPKSHTPHHETQTFSLEGHGGVFSFRIGGGGWGKG